MNLLFNPAFWIGIIAVHLVLSMCPAGLKSVAFGILNGILLLLLVGSAAALAVAVFAVLLWACLRVLQIVRGGKGLIGAAIAPLIVALALTFLAYKVLRDHSADAQWLARAIPALRLNGVLAACAAISFSYVFLRAVDVATAVASGDAALMDPVSLTGYLAPFHMLAAGPVTNYREHASIAQTGGAPQSFTTFVDGINDVVSGLFYKFVIAQSLKIYAFGTRRGSPRRRASPTRCSCSSTCSSTLRAIHGSRSASGGSAGFRLRRISGRRSARSRSPISGRGGICRLGRSSHETSTRHCNSTWFAVSASATRIRPTWRHC